MKEELLENDQKLIAILEKIINLFYEFGIRNLNMDDISRHLKISKKTLYQYVKSKEDLVEKLFEYDDLRWNNKLSEIKVRELNAIDILVQVSIMVFDELNRLNPKLKFELMKYYEHTYMRFMQRKQDHILHQISLNIEKGKTEGLYRPDVDVELSAGLYVRNLVDMHNKDYCFMANITHVQVFEGMFENHIRAISTPEGTQYFEKRKLELSQLHKNNNL